MSELSGKITAAFLAVAFWVTAAGGGAYAEDASNAPSGNTGSSVVQQAEVTQPVTAGIKPVVQSTPAGLKPLDKEAGNKSVKTQKAGKAADKNSCFSTGTMSASKSGCGFTDQKICVAQPKGKSEAKKVSASDKKGYGAQLNETGKTGEKAASEQTAQAPPKCVSPADTTVVSEQGPVPEKIDYDKAVQYAVSKHPDILIAKEKINQARSQYIDAKSALEFKFKLYGSYTRLDPAATVDVMGMKLNLSVHDNFTGRATLEKVISTFGNAENAISAAALNVQAAEENYQKVYQDVAYSAKQSYFEALRAEGNRSVAKENIDIVREQLKLANDLFDAGIQPRYEVLRNELFFSQAQQTLITNQKNVEMAISNMLSTLNMDIQTKVELDIPDKVKMIKVNLEDAQKLATENRHELKSLRISIEAAHRLLAAAMANKNPVLSFVSVAENKTLSGLSGDANTFTQSLVLNIPIFDGGVTNAKVMSAKASIKELEENLEKMTRAVKLEVKDSVLSIQEMEAKMDASRKDVETAKEGYQIALARYENGISTTLELDDARRSYSNSQAIYINILYEYGIAVAKLEKATASTWKGVQK
ncbi:MAG: TolC family protein [Firmicutes bacterium]|nr:TolC family protein [Bacillota bacterium]